MIIADGVPVYMTKTEKDNRECFYNVSTHIWISLGLYGFDGG